MAEETEHDRAMAKRFPPLGVRRDGTVDIIPPGGKLPDDINPKPKLIDMSILDDDDSPELVETYSKLLNEPDTVESE